MTYEIPMDESSESRDLSVRHQMPIDKGGQVTEDKRKALTYAYSVSLSDRLLYEELGMQQKKA